MNRLIGAIAAAAAVAVALPIVAFVALLEMFFQAGGDIFGGLLSDFETWYTSATTSAVLGGEHECTIDDPEALRSDLATGNGWRGPQAENATVVYLAAAERGLGDRAALIGLITAYQESRLYNYANFNVEESLEYDHDKIGDDHDSVGVFQQRPSAGWGSVKDLMNPEYAAGAFYDKLVTIDGWETMAPTEAAQAVQISAYPDAYARWEGYATGAIVHFTEHVACTLLGGAWVHPLPKGTFWGSYRTPERPGHDGVDLGADKGTEILAASAGTVVRVRCNASRNGVDYSCDIDGSPEVAGCGWYVDLLHADATRTRYCHMLTEPLVDVGNTVQARQVIGHVGNSGSSSAPHLHFEIRLNASSESAGEPTDPVAFMQTVGIDLKETGDIP